MANDPTPKTDKPVQFSVQMTPELKDRLHAAADERMLNPGVLARKAIEEFLDRLVPVDDLVLVREPGAAAPAPPAPAPAHPGPGDTGA